MSHKRDSPFRKARVSANDQRYQEGEQGTFLERNPGRETRFEGNALGGSGGEMETRLPPECAGCTKVNAAKQECWVYTDADYQWENGNRCPGKVYDWRWRTYCDEGHEMYLVTGFREPGECRSKIPAARCCHMCGKANYHEHNERTNDWVCHTCGQRLHPGGLEYEEWRRDYATCKAGRGSNKAV